MKGKFDAYVLRPLAKKLQNWIVGRFTAQDFTICTKYNNFLWVYWSLFKDQLILTYQRRNSISELTLYMNNVTFLNSHAYETHSAAQFSFEQHWSTPWANNCDWILLQVILFEIDFAIFYTNLNKVFCQFISWTGKFRQVYGQLLNIMSSYGW